MRAVTSSLTFQFRPRVQAILCLLAVVQLLCSSVLPASAEEAKPGPRYSVQNFKQMLKLQSNTELVLQKHLAGQELVRRLVPSPIGAVAIRWPSTLYAEQNFAPTEAVKRAWAVAGEILTVRAFPEQVQAADFDWSVAFVNGVQPMLKSSQRNSDYFHLAWMGPPADIVVDLGRWPLPSQGELVRALVHEIGHAVEYRLMGEAFSLRQRWHSEGFATWFETLRDDVHVPSSDSNSQRTLAMERARRFFRTSWKPYLFEDKPADYAQSYAMMAAIAGDGNQDRLFAVYRRMSADGVSFENAVERELGWDLPTWLAETAAYLAVSG